MANVLRFALPVALQAGPATPVDGPPLVVDARRLAKFLCAGLRTVRAWDAAGKLPSPIRLGGKVVWRLDEIRDWLAAGAPRRDEWQARRTAARK